MINPYSALFLLFPERADSRTTSAFLTSRKEYTAKELSEFVKEIGEAVSSFIKGSGNVDNNYHGWHLNSMHDIIIHSKDRKILELAEKFKKIEENYLKSIG